MDEEKQLTPEEIQEQKHQAAIQAFASMFAKANDESHRRVDTRIIGYTIAELIRYLEMPHNYQTELINISNAIYRISGFYQKLVDLLAKTGLNYWTVDTSVINDRFYTVRAQKLKKDFIAYSGAVDRLQIDKYLPEAMLRVLLEDTCYGYWIDTDTDSPYIYWLPSLWCDPRKTINGMILYGISPNRVSQLDRERLPPEIVDVLNQPITDARDPFVYPPPEKCFCLKWNSMYTYNYPPLFNVIKDILDIDDFKALLKAKVESENYNALGMEIPSDDEHQDKMMLTEKTVAPIVNFARRVLPDSIGVIPSPLKLEPIQWRSSGVADRNHISDSIDMLYDEAGIPKEIMSSASNGAELKAAITNFSSGIFSIYRQMEISIGIKMMLEGYIYPSYRFVYKILDITQFNKDDYAANELKFAQYSTPNKFRLLASMGMNPARLFGNERIENEVFQVGQNWMPLKSSYTTTEEDIVVSEGGRPTNESVGEPLSEAGQTTVDTGANNPDNRV